MPKEFNFLSIPNVLKQFLLHIKIISFNANKERQLNIFFSLLIFHSKTMLMKHVIKRYLPIQVTNKVCA